MTAGIIGANRVLNRKDRTDLVRRFLQSDERVLILPFAGLRCDVSKHWHQFLETSFWQLLKKTAVLAVTRNLHSGPLKNALLRSIGMKVGRHVFIAATVQFDIQFPELVVAAGQFRDHLLEQAGLAFDFFGFLVEFDECNDL